MAAVMKRNFWFKAFVLLVLSAVLRAGTAAAFPHFHADLSGREKEECSPCFLHQAIQPLAEVGISSASPVLIQFPLPEPPSAPVFSRLSFGCADSRAPPVLL